MNKRENSFKKYLIRIMGARWSVQSHEDQYSEGIPDLSFGFGGVNGWIELKQIDQWPKRETTLAKPKKYTPQQSNWLSKRGLKGGNCFVFVKIGKDEYFLFHWSMARKIRMGMTKEEYHANCLKKWRIQVEPGELMKVLLNEK